MKANLATAIATAIIGALLAYFGTGLFIGEMSSETVQTIQPVDTSLVNPSPEVFNYKAINPTVEVYVDSCTNYDENGNCLDQDSEDEPSDADASDSESDGQEESPDDQAIQENP